MNFKYDILFTVNFRHAYFKGGNFNGLNVVPLSETTLVMRNYGLIFKSFPDHFTVMYDTEFAGTARSREMILQEDITMNFRLNLTDFALYNYTGNLPSAINNAIFYFSNVAEDGSFKKGTLHQEDFVSTKDFIDAAATKDRYFSLPFGHVDLRFHQQLEKNMEIKFAARSVYWQYILLAGHMKDLNAPAIFNKSTRRVFKGPEIVYLPENRTGIAFVRDVCGYWNSAYPRDRLLPLGDAFVFLRSDPTWGVSCKTPF